MKKIIQVEGMSCHHCEMRVENALKSLSFVKKAKASSKSNTVEVEIKDQYVETEIEEAIKDSGYVFKGIEE